MIKLVGLIEKSRDVSSILCGVEMHCDDHEEKLASEEPLECKISTHIGRQLLTYLVCFIKRIFVQIPLVEQDPATERRPTLECACHWVFLEERADDRLGRCPDG